jgi:hypothetical protein
VRDKTGPKRLGCGIVTRPTGAARFAMRPPILDP